MKTAYASPSLNRLSEGRLAVGCITDERPADGWSVPVQVTEKLWKWLSDRGYAAEGEWTDIARHPDRHLYDLHPEATVARCSE